MTDFTMSTTGCTVTDFTMSHVTEFTMSHRRLYRDRLHYVHHRLYRDGVHCPITGCTVTEFPMSTTGCTVTEFTMSHHRLYRDRILTESDRRAGMEVHPGGVVYITEVQEQHEGRYTCMALTPTDLLERSIWLTIKEPCSLGESPGLPAVDGSPSWKLAHSVSLLVYWLWMAHHQGALLTR